MKECPISGEQGRSDAERPYKEPEAGWARELSERAKQESLTFILPGDNCVDTFKAKFPGAKFIVCRENMAEGAVPLFPVFSSDWNQARAKALGVSVEDYEEKLSPLIHLNANEAEYVLLFGGDSTCFANRKLLNLYLLQICYKGRVTNCLINERLMDIIAPNLPIDAIL